MQRAHAVPVLALALTAACLSSYYQPPAEGTTADDVVTTTSTSGTSTGSPEVATGPKFDIPYPDLPDPACEQQPLAADCEHSCASSWPAAAEVCDVDPFTAPAPFYPLLVDCSCSDSVDVVLVDLDHDGFDDIVSACAYESRAVVHYGGSTRPLACPVEHAVLSSPWSVAVADFDMDGHLDILAGNDGFSLLRGRGGRSFGPQEVVLVPDLSATSRLTAADLDADGDPDLIAHDHGLAQVLLGDGLGGFVPGQTITLPPTCSIDQVDDLDGDAFVDLVRACSEDGGVQYHRGDGHGGFAEAAPLVASDQRLEALTIADLDGDLNRDLVLLREADIAVAIAVVPGEYGPLEPIGPAFVGQAIAAVDLDGEDGLLEILVHGTDYNNPEHQTARTRLLTGDHQQGFTLAATLVHAQQVLQPHFGDFNGDGRLDLVFGHYLSAYNDGGIYYLESAP
ncbi:FG-GAP repeat domain-containing protein [Nannocystis punicea]|uniref:VCBS repeat-containing protein n=1 Tax=Nannocystis punicea TaxID=2995304 RepID=A0ABY7HHP3_9BACT|nr:VCBS repeat-containing protein [Nannocystis poenicansa]WAS98827.1 VCBS repeat-containing protein [Nannocystis poenicansa]